MKKLFAVTLFLGYISFSCSSSGTSSDITGYELQDDRSSMLDAVDHPDARPDTEPKSDAGQTDGSALDLGDRVAPEDGKGDAPDVGDALDTGQADHVDAKDSLHDETGDAGPDQIQDTEPSDAPPDVEVLGPCDAPCLGKQCGMAGSCYCGACPGSGLCVEGQCVCEASCAGKVCGDDGCGGNCGGCPFPQVCSDMFGQCFPSGLNCLGEPGDKYCKISVLQFGDGGYPGEGLDVDDNADTCAPPGDCSDGVDNQASALVQDLMSFIVINPEVQSLITFGYLVVLFDFQNFVAEQEDFDLRVFTGAPDGSSEYCDLTEDVCSYIISSSMFDQGSCLPINEFGNAVVDDGYLRAGGANYKLRMDVSIFDEVLMPITIYNCRLVGDVSLSGPVRIDNGIISGALRESELIDSIAALPPSVLAQISISIDILLPIIDAFIVPDIDTNGDGIDDAISVGLTFRAIPANVLGAF